MNPAPHAHTAGPWRVSSVHRSYIVADHPTKPGKTVTLASCTYNSDGDGQLFAAAPALLAALEHIHDYMSGRAEMDAKDIGEIFLISGAAITQATAKP